VAISLAKVDRHFSGQSSFDSRVRMASGIMMLAYSADTLISYAQTPLTSSQS
jgi:hypothetical protein